MKILAITCVSILLSFHAVHAKHLHLEKHYQEKDCYQRGHIATVEYVLEDYTRVDCLTEEYAIEYDFADKAYECISQAIHYGNMAGRKAKCILIQESENDLKYINRAREIVKAINSCKTLVYLDVIK